MRTAVLSDLHLGARTRIDLLARPEVRQRLMTRLRGCDEVVLLGDAVELRDRPIDTAIAAAAPFLTDLGSVMQGGRVVLVPGNHDHRLAHEALELRWRARRRTALGIGTSVRPGDGGAVGSIRRLLGTELVVAYPGWWIRVDVWATHGHYLDAHSAAPTLECAATAALGALRRSPAARACTPLDYERLLAPTYGLYFHIAQRPSLHRAADAGKRLVGAAEARLGARGGRDAGARRRVELGGGRLRTAPGEYRRPGVRPIGRVLERLGVDAAHVVFGHTHRTGPVSGDDPRVWSTSGGTALWNTGSWVHEPEYIGEAGTASPYWPGTLVMVETSAAPAVARLLGDGLPCGDGRAGDERLV